MHVCYARCSVCPREDGCLDVAFTCSGPVQTNKTMYYCVVWDNVSVLTHTSLNSFSFVWNRPKLNHLSSTLYIFSKQTLYYPWWAFSKWKFCALYLIVSFHVFLATALTGPVTYTTHVRSSFFPPSAQLPTLEPDSPVFTVNNTAGETCLSASFNMTFNIYVNASTNNDKVKVSYLRLLAGQDTTCAIAGLFTWDTLTWLWICLYVKRFAH